MHLNISSLILNFDELKHFIIDYNFDVISLNETRLDSSINNHSISIPGYQLLRNDRNRNGGGVALYVKEHLCPSKVNFHALSESIWAYTKLKNNHLAIGSVYRPPSSNVKYFDYINDDLEFITSKGYDIIVLGDFNVDYSATYNHNRVHIDNLENLFDLRQLITSPPTRETVSCSSLIDHIYASTSLTVHSSGVLELSLSDHYATFALFDIIPDKHDPRIIKCRNFKNFDQSKFISDIVHSNIFERILQISKVNDAWQFFKTEYLFICNKNAPLREIRVKHRFNPWFSNEIQQAIYERNRLHKLAILKKSVELFKEFTCARNKVTSLVRQAKRKFYSDHLSNNN